MGGEHDVADDDYWGLHAWSITERGAFWSAVWDFCGLIGDKGQRQAVDGDLMPGARFLPDATLNFAENLLRLEGPADAIVFRDEGEVRRRDALHRRRPGRRHLHRTLSHRPPSNVKVGRAR